jgi:hypothetical protein
MKQSITKSIKLLSISIFILFTNNCSDNDTLIMTEEESKVVISSTRSTIAQNIPFVWDDSNNPKINIGGSEITLPFYSGAATSGLPEHVVADYKKEDGWVMVYNFITDPALYVTNRNMFILYNKFKGILRIFYYNTITPTIGQVTFANIRITDAYTKLFNSSNVEIYCLPISETSSQNIYTTNILTSASKAFCIGWNCFDIELSYDDTYKNNPYKMANIGIGFSDKLSFKVDLNGINNTHGQLSYVETTSSNPMGDFSQSIFNAIGAASGKEAEKIISPENNSELRSATAIIGSAVSSIISNLVSAVTKSWTSSFAKETNTYKTIDIKTLSKLTIAGNITGDIPSVGIGIQNLPIPGSTPDGAATTRPIYNAPLGVWNLKSLKTVKIGDHIFPTIENIVGGYPTSPESYPVTADIGEYIQINVPTYGVEDVIINDSVLSCISKYEVKSEIFYKKMTGNDRINDSILVNSAIQWYRNASGKYLYYKDKHYIDQSYWQYLNSDNYERRSTSDVYFDPTYLKFIAKVTLLLYPKAPYNTDIISSTRTFQCNTEKIITPSKGRVVMGAYN